MTEPKPRVLSGVQPTGTLHIGNWLGAIRNWVRDLNQFDGYFPVVDLHALTVPQVAGQLREKTLEVAATYLACGLDPRECCVFVQSQVPAHSELAWLLDCFLPMGWLQRMTQFKVRSRSHHERASVGLFNYPALMASDILLYDARYVPVGDDQRQHVEMARDIAQRVNTLVGPLFTVPEIRIGSSGSRIMGLDNPNKKMSKSTAIERPMHAVALLDPPDRVQEKVARSKTDDEAAVSEDPGPGVLNLLEIYRTVAGLGKEAVLEQFAGRSYRELKEEVTAALVDTLTPIQERYRAVRSDDAQLVATLAESSATAATTAGFTLTRVKEAVGLLSPSVSTPGREPPG